MPGVFFLSFKPLKVLSYSLFLARYVEPHLLEHLGRLEEYSSFHVPISTGSKQTPWDSTVAKKHYLGNHSSGIDGNLIQEPYILLKTQNYNGFWKLLGEI